MKHLTLFEQFTNESKDAKKQFQSLKIGDKVRYMGFDHIVVKADGVIAKLEDEDGKFYTINFNQFRQKGELLEGKPAGAPDFHDSKAPDAHGKFKDLSVKDLAKWLIDTRNGDVKKISASLTQQVVFNRNDNPEYADKMEKTRQEVYKQLGREDLMEAKAKPGPDKYMTGLDDKDEEKKEDQIKKQREMDDDDSDAYKEMPGDKEAREEGRVKTSKHVKKYHELYGDETDEALSDYEIKKKGYKKLYKDYPYKKKTKKKELVKEASEQAYSLSRLAGGIGQDEAEEFLNKHDINMGIVMNALRSNKINKYDLRDVIQGKASKSIEKKVMNFIAESVNEALRIACLECDEVNTAKAWKKNNDVCPSCNDSTNGVSEAELVGECWKGYRQDGMKTKDGKQVPNCIPVSELNEEKADGDRSPLDNADIEKALKKKSEETGVPIGLIRIIMRRGMAAWKTGHRPGAGQEQWGYARVNAFLTKGEGTWGGADKDVAKEVRDGGYDKKLKS